MIDRTATFAQLRQALLARLLHLKQLQVMPDHTNNRPLISRKLQTKRLLSLTDVQNREDVEGTTIIRQVSALHSVREVASDNIFDLIEPRGIIHVSNSLQYPSP